MAKRKTSRRSSTTKRRSSKKLKADFVREQMGKGRTKKQAFATYKMLRSSARYRRGYNLTTPNVGRGYRRNPDDEPDLNIANPGEAEFIMGEGTGGFRGSEGPLFDLWFGAYGSTHVYVWADSFDSAFEEAVEWLDDEELCGVFVKLDEGDMLDAAKEEGFSEREAKALLSEMKSGEWSDDLSKIVERAEADLTMIGHTSLRNCEKQLGGGPLYVPSWEWGGNEVVDQAEIKRVYDESLRQEEEDED